MAGDYILAVVSIMISQLRNDDVTLTLSQVKFINRDFTRFILSAALAREDPRNSRNFDIYRIYNRGGLCNFF